ncbi:ABC transporter permease [Nitratireductor indicus]|uniref:Binding-protein-dependent transport system inner membrane protein n=1 Tax=Nitratireductor indicus C115 TaxID=1231190 RepID=K2P484_9HYPH|nr:ABC transporter permease [Nitratireductor indicus]EKF42166.1 binding-protein-dependent transport system inner membrane protein [Nitratireductor indicus C115]MDS1136244.1 ABC transporter permease [Nitratireductor indicus]SFQ61506.1 peptide/nickel transport system permease protein [Nitratireductor indicus]
MSQSVNSTVSPSLVQRARRIASREPGLALGLLILTIILVVALFPSLFATHSPFNIDVNAAMQPPSAEHWFGTDDVGRDVYSRIVYGARITLSICAGSLFLSALIGGSLGLVSGYFGGLADQLLGRLIDVLLSFPPIILGVIITGILGPQTVNLILALSMVYMPVFFRIARAGAMSETGKTYVEAARSMGITEATILRKHVTRNVMPLIFTQYMILFPLILQIQSALGFLGLGVQPPAPDWGAILEQGKDFILFAPWMSVFPGLAVLLASLSLILVGRALQKRVDQR